VLKIRFKKVVLTIVSVLMLGLFPGSIDLVHATTSVCESVACEIVCEATQVQQDMGIESFAAPCSCVFHNNRVIGVQAALVFNTSAATSAMGQVHRGTGIYLVSSTTNRRRVDITRGTRAQHNGWLGDRVWINRGTYQCCLL